MQLLADDFFFKFAVLVTLSWGAINWQRQQQEKIYLMIKESYDTIIIGDRRRMLLSLSTDTSNMSTSAALSSGAPDANFDVRIHSNNNRNSSALVNNASSSITTNISQRSMSACLLVRNDDNNVFLAEWVAYHYTVLPLRYLIVGTDKKYTKDPMDVLHRWKGTDLRFEVWYSSNNDAKGGSYNNTQHQQQRPLKRYVDRRKQFFSQCLQHFHQEGSLSWVALVDATDYIQLNPFSDNGNNTLHQGAKSFGWNESQAWNASIPHLNPTETQRRRAPEVKWVRQGLKIEVAQKVTDASPVQAAAARRRLEPAKTVMDVIEDYSSEYYIPPCQTMSRLRCSSVNSNCTDSAHGYPYHHLNVPDINISNLNTSRYQNQSNATTLRRRKKWRNVLIDLRRIPLPLLANNILSPNINMLLLDVCDTVPDLVRFVHVRNHECMSDVHDGEKDDALGEKGDALEEKIATDRFIQGDARRHLMNRTKCNHHTLGWWDDFFHQFGVARAKYLLGKDEAY